MNKVHTQSLTNTEVKRKQSQVVLFTSATIQETTYNLLLLVYFWGLHLGFVDYI